MARGHDDKRICVGRIGAPHGVRGEVRLWSFTEDPMAIAGYGTLQAADGARSFEIEALRPAKGFLVARLKGVTDRTAASKLANIDLYVARERLPEIEDNDEFYHADLVGLAVMDRGGEPLGEIVAVHNFGAGDLLELKLDGMPETRLIPFTQATVPEIDLAGGKVIVILPVEIEASEQERDELDDRER
jgi:16S rRNA processing protein RimM